MIDPKQIIDWLKISGKQAFVLCLISSIFLFGTPELIEKLGLTAAKQILQPWVGVIWLISLSILISDAFFPIYQWCKNELKWRINLKKYQQQLHELTFEEKGFLSQYIANNTKTVSAQYSDGIVKELEASNIIRMASNLSHHHTVFPYNIQPWAWEYLKQHPECLEHNARNIGV